MISIPTPHSAINLAMRNIAMFTDLAHKAAPIIDMMQPSCIDLRWPYFVAVHEVKTAAMADPVELTQFIAPIS